MKNKNFMTWFVNLFYYLICGRRCSQTTLLCLVPDRNRCRHRLPLLSRSGAVNRGWYSFPLKDQFSPRSGAGNLGWNSFPVKDQISRKQTAGSQCDCVLTGRTEKEQKDWFHTVKLRKHRFIFTVYFQYPHSLRPVRQDIKNLRASVGLMFANRTSSKKN